MKKIIIGILGFKQSGKDTIGNFLVEKYNFRKTAFAHNLKKAVSIIFDIPEELCFGSEEDKNQLTRVKWSDLQDIEYKDPKIDLQFLSVREVLKLFATEVCRAKIPDIWTKFINLSGDRVVVTDVRFPNEVELIKNNGGVLLEVTRPGTAASNHASEKKLSDNLIDYSIANDGTIEELYLKVISTIEKIID